MFGGYFRGCMTFDSGFSILVRQLESSHAHPCTKPEMIYQDLVREHFEEETKPKNHIIYKLHDSYSICQFLNYNECHNVSEYLQSNI